MKYFFVTSISLVFLSGTSAKATEQEHFGAVFPTPAICKSLLASDYKLTTRFFIDKHYFREVSKLEDKYYIVFHRKAKLGFGKTEPQLRVYASSKENCELGLAEARKIAPDYIKGK